MLAILLSSIPLLPFGAGTDRAIVLSNTNEATVGYVRVADDAGLEPQTFTLEAWLTPTGSGFGQTATGAVIAAKSDEGAVGDWLVSYGLEWRVSDLLLTGFVAHDIGVSGAVVVSESPVELFETVHVAVTFDGTFLRLFVNCEEEASVETPASNVDYGDEDLLIGAANFGAGFERRFQGEIDEVRLWDHARTAPSIAALQDCPLSGDEPGLLAYYSFNADDARDDGPHGHDGIFVGQVAAADSGAIDCAAPCPWDMNCSGAIDVGDLLTMLGAWGSEPQGPPDFDGGGVAVSDLLELLANWGACP